jgi:hypothetical protein
MPLNIFIRFFIFFVFFIAGCEIDRPDFTSHPGFAEYFNANPPPHEIPGPLDQELLSRFRPRFMLPAGHQKPIDFYRDYIANGILRNGSGEIISRNVTQKMLNDYKVDPGAVFVHVPGSDSNQAVVYGSIKREDVPFDTEKGQVHQPFTFLSDNIVFRTSGPPIGIPDWQDTVLSFFYDLNDWHQLDHFTAVTLVIEGEGHGEGKPVAVMLQQHDNLRTYLVGEGIDVPVDGRVMIDVSIRSNELYPHMTGRNRHRAVRQPDSGGLYFLISGKKKPILAGYDITDSVREAEYTLEFLRPDDAFYTFKGALGERRLLPGRDGPPGANFNTLPELKPIKRQLFYGYWRENNPGDLERLEKTIVQKDDYIGFARLQSAVFFSNRDRLQKKGEIKKCGKKGYILLHICTMKRVSIIGKLIFF